MKQHSNGNGEKTQSGRRPFLFGAGFLWAVLEASLLGVLGCGALLAFHEVLTPRVAGQSVFFASPATALWLALRLRLPKWGGCRPIVRELGAGVLLCALLAGGCLGAVDLFGWSEVLQQTTWNQGIISVFLLASGPIFVGLRIAVHVWIYWGGLRERHLRWALTHAQLQLVLVVALCFTVVSLPLLLVTLSSAPESVPPGVALLFDRIVFTLLPFLGLEMIMVVVVLLVLLPPAAFISYLSARRTTRRLEALAATASALRSGDYAARVAVEGEDEVAHLQDDFNAMASDLEQTMHDLQNERIKVDQLLQTRRTLVAGVSHELRTPVSTLRGYLESMLGNWKGEEPAEHLRRDIEIMEREVVRLQRLIDDLFTLSRAEVDSLALDIAPTDVAELIRHRAEAMASLAWERGRVELSAEVAPDLPAVMADAGRLDQVLINLLRNAIRFTPPGGIILIAASVEEEHVRIDVRDTGQGIAPGDLPQIWTRFFRGSENDRVDDESAGLGLPLVKELTEAMGGVVAVESTLGQGSCFTVRLPVA